MRILFVTQYFAPEIGAAPVRLTALANALQDIGHEVSVVTSLPNYPVGRTFREYRWRFFFSDDRKSGVRVHRIWTFPAKGAGLARYINYLSFVVTAPLLLARARRADLILVESPPLTTAVIGWFFSRILRAPMLLNIADLWPDAVVELGLVDESDRQVRLARKLEMWSYGKASLVSYATVGIGDSLADKGVNRERMIFLPNGADTTVFAPKEPMSDLAADLGLEEQKIVLYAGTHSVAAGMDVLLETARLLESDESIVIVVVGDGPAKAPLVEAAARRGLGNLVFLDPVQPERVSELYSISVAGVVTLADNPMFTGTRPAKMFPALACAKPVIYSGHGEGADLVTRHHMGVVVPPGDPVALASAIRSVIEAPDDAEMMGANGRSFVLSNLSWGSIAETWVSEVGTRLALTRDDRPSTNESSS